MSAVFLNAITIETNQDIDFIHVLLWWS